MLNIKDFGYVQKIDQVLKTCIWDYKKIEHGDISFLFNKLTVHA